MFVRNELRKETSLPLKEYDIIPAGTKIFIKDKELVVTESQYLSTLSTTIGLFLDTIAVFNKKTEAGLHFHHIDRDVF